MARKTWHKDFKLGGHIVMVPYMQYLWYSAAHKGRIPPAWKYLDNTLSRNLHVSEILS